MDEGINSMVDTIHELEAENEKLKFRLSNVNGQLVAFANFVGDRPLPEYSKSTNKWRWWNNNTRNYDYATTEELLAEWEKATNFR